MSQQSPSKKISRPIKCGKPYIAKPGTSVVVDFDWAWNDAERQFKPVQVGSTDLQNIVDQSAGSDLRSMLNRQDGKTPAEKLANAVDSGLLTVDLSPNQNPWDYGSQVQDLTGLPTDKMSAEMEVKAAESRAAALNKELGLKGEDARSFEDYFKGKADAIIRQYIDERIKAAQPIEQPKGDE